MEDMSFQMNASGVIETTVNYKPPPKKMEADDCIADTSEGVVASVPTTCQPLSKKLSTPVLASEKIKLSSRSNSDLGMKANFKNLPLQKSKSLETDNTQEKYSRLCESRSVTPSPPPLQVPLLPLKKIHMEEPRTTQRNLSPIASSNDNSPTEEKSEDIKPTRPKLLNVSGLLFVKKKSKSNLFSFCVSCRVKDNLFSNLKLPF